MPIPEYVRIEAKKELARRYFYDYCTLRYPKHYTKERQFLKDVCERMQAFTEQNDKRFLVINIPPRHYKSFTGTNFIEWLFGKYPDKKAMTGSYNETLSTTFARKVRDTIEEKKSEGVLVYNDIFPDTKVKYGQASASLWALQGSSQDNYLATSPTGTATGFGANVVLVDDILKNAEEAYNEMVKDKQWSWLVNTMLSRTEGDDWKVIVIMTRWATDDLAGRILSEFADQAEHITYKAVQDDGTMLCDDVLNKSDYILKTREMNPDIVEANYNQTPIDIKGKLYSDFATWDSLPEGTHRKLNYTDTADKGKDYLCSVNYVEYEGEAYITDLVMSDEPMEVTEPMVAKMFYIDEVNEAVIESNSGGRGFARNIERMLKEQYKSTKTVIRQVPQTANKESRILTSSAWVNNHIYMPYNWKNKYPEFYKQLMKYQKKGKNAHDDAPDVLAGIYETVTNRRKFDFDFL
jgi:predicted phage terminase large subunit-like protein